MLFNEMNRETITELAPTHIAILPVGATEQHGPHLPTGTDTFAVEHIVRSAAERLADQVPVIVAPTLPFGSSNHHFPFGGTLSLNTTTYYAVLRDLVDSLVRDGFQRMLLINGHGGNHELIQLAARDVVLEKEVVVGSASYWQSSNPELVESGAFDTARAPGHAGHFETSVVMALRPELIAEPRPNRKTDPSLIDSADLSSRIRIERFDFYHLIEGFTDSPATATADLGQHYIDAAIQGVAHTISAFDSATKKLGTCI